MIKGCDISAHTKGVQIADIKNKYDFVIVRGMCNKDKDTEFEKFYADAKKIGLPIGVYHYINSKNVVEAIADANSFYENCIKNHSFEYPIVCDIEDRYYNTINEHLYNDIIQAYCKTLESKNLYVSLYCNCSFYTRCNTLTKNSYDLWLAHWNVNKPRYECGLWQSSANGYIGKYNVDVNIAFKDYPAIMKKYQLNNM